MTTFSFLSLILFVNTIFQLILFFITTIKLQFKKMMAFKLIAYYCIIVINIFCILPLLYQKNILTTANIITIIIILLLTYTLNFLFDEEFIFNFSKLQNFILNLVLSTIIYILLFMLFI